MSTKARLPPRSKDPLSRLATTGGRNRPVVEHVAVTKKCVNIWLAYDRDGYDLAALSISPARLRQWLAAIEGN